MRLPEDEQWMRLALELARGSLRLSPPNPAVGAVIVRDGRVLGRGATQAAGSAHAEVMALRDAKARGQSVKGATLYVTLEPCSHYGRTPPCALAIIEHGLGRVVSALEDPNPLVAGKGLAMLEAAGIAVTRDVCRHEAYEVNIGFMTRMTTGRPWVRLKCAATLDGRTAFNDGRSQWITGEAARRDGWLWRGRAGAIVTGIGTVRADNPSMTVRLPDQVRRPLRVVVDGRWETPVTAKILSPDAPVLIVGGAPDPQRMQALTSAGARVLSCPDEQNPSRVNLGRMLEALAGEQVNEVHLEAGAVLNGAFLDRDLVDEMVLYTAPCLFGSGKPIAGVAEPSDPGQAVRWQIKDFTQIDTDLRTVLRRRA